MLNQPPRRLADQGEPRGVTTVALWAALCGVLVAVGWFSVSLVASLIRPAPSGLNPGPVERVPSAPVSAGPIGDGSTPTTSTIGTIGTIGTTGTTSGPAPVEGDRIQPT